MEKRGKLGFFIVIIGFIILAILVSGKIDKIDNKIYTKLSSEDKAKVIVVLNDNQKSIREENIEKIGEDKITHKFSSMNAYSAELNLEDISKLEEDINVKKVYFDNPVSISLTDSVGIVNATRSLAIQSYGVNLSGNEQTVCVVDTGINYSHSSLGGCSISALTNNGTNESNIVQSAHPYTNNYDYTWNITQPGYSKIAVHFVNISLEYPGQGGWDSTDRVIIYDSQMREIARYHSVNNSGVIGLFDFWTPYSDGNTIYIRLTTDVSVTGYGFYADQVRNGTTNNSYNWSGCTKILNGWDFVNNEGDPYDDHGHGTHVAGIVAATGDVTGIAPSAKLIVAKSLNSAGTGYNSDVIAAIEYCTNNSEKYNISVITMSLSGETKYTNYCDSEDPLTAAAINKAVAKNISVLVASGNDGWSDGITSPSCIENATPIGNSDKNDAIFSSSNRNSLVKLFAVGTSVTSTCYTGLTCSKTGTSMATPMVAGAYAIFNQYLKSLGRKMNPSEIETIFNNTGKIIEDTTGINYSRINIYSALSIINDYPKISLDSPTDSGTASRNWIIINASANDSNTKNITIYVYNSTSLVNSTSSNSNSYYTNLSVPRGGLYFFSANVTDSFNLINSSEIRNITLSFSGPAIIINSPYNYQNFSSRLVSINFNVSDADGISYTNISLINSTGYYLNSTLNTSSGNISLSLSSSLDGIITMSIVSYDNNGNSNSTSRNITIDTTPPTITIYSPVNNTRYYVNQTFNLFYYVNDALTSVFSWYNFNETTNISSSNLTNVQINYTTTGIKTIMIYANDSLNNTVRHQIQLNLTIINSTKEVIPNSTVYNVSSTIDTIIIPYNSSVQNITLTNSSQVVSIDFTQILSNGTVNNPTNLTLVTQSTNNYTAIIYSGTNISGNGWDGKINLPTINSSSFSAPSGTANLILDIGKDSEINFSSPVKILIGGMAGKKAAWSRGSLNLTEITTICNSSYSNIDRTTNRECYVDSGSDLLIWTYHFTSFAAYTPASTTTTTTSSSSSGGGGATGGNTTNLLPYLVSSAELESGYTKGMLIGEKMKFELYGNHSLTLYTYTAKAVTLILNSSYEKFSLNISQERKFDLNSDGYKDLSVKLNSIIAAKASITIKKINEVPIIINKTIVENKTITKNETIQNSPKEEEFNYQMIYYLILMIIILGISYLGYRIYKNYK